MKSATKSDMFLMIRALNGDGVFKRVHVFQMITLHFIQVSRLVFVKCLGENNVLTDLHIKATGQDSWTAP